MKKMIITGIALFLVISTACSHESNAKTPHKLTKKTINESNMLKVISHTRLSLKHSP